MATADKNFVSIQETSQGVRVSKDERRKSRISSDVSAIKKRSSTMSKYRRSSYGFGRLSGVSSISGRSRSNYSTKSGTGLEGRRPHRKYLNTYQLEPRKPFDYVKVTKIVETTLEDLFMNHEYNPNLSPSLALMIAGEIRYRVRYLQYERYRIISVVTIGQRRSQSYNNAVAFLWDHERDGYTNCTAQVQTAFVQATVFALYLD